MNHPFWKGNGLRKIHIDYNGGNQALEFRYLERDPITGKNAYLSPGEMVSYERFENRPVKPFFSVHDGDDGILQGMFDALWRIGIRPTDLGTIDSTLAAKDQNLDDLRRIAFHALGVPNVPNSK